MSREELSQVLKRMIRESGESLRDIEAATGIDRGRLSRFMSNERTLTLPAVDLLCKHFGLRLTKARKRHD